MNTIRAKFRCTSVAFRGDHLNPDTPREYQLSAVYDTDTPENRRFARATPWGDIKMQVNNPHAVLEVGEDYYLDFTKCADAQALEEKAEAVTYTKDAGYLAEAPDAATHHPDPAPAVSAE